MPSGNRPNQNRRIAGRTPVTLIPHRIPLLTNAAGRLATPPLSRYRHRFQKIGRLNLDYFTITSGN